MPPRATRTAKRRTPETASERNRRARAPHWGSGALVAFALVLGSACRSAKAPSPTQSLVVPLQTRNEPVDPRFAPALEALQRAVEDGDDRAARSVLDALMARGPEGRALELAEGYERILRGRELVSALELELLVRPLDSAPATYELVLRARHELPGDVWVHAAPAELFLLTTALDLRGLEVRRANTNTLEGMEDFRLPRGEVSEWVLARRRAVRPGAIGVRERWKLHLRSGDVRLDTEEGPGERLPFRAPELAAAEFEAPAIFLPTAPVEPEEFVRYATGEVVNLPPLLERAVRIEPARRREALEALAARLHEIEDERLIELLPALRWLARQGRDHTDPATWRDFLAGLDRYWELAPEETDLDLPRGLAELDSRSSGLDLP